MRPFPLADKKTLLILLLLALVILYSWNTSRDKLSIEEFFSTGASHSSFTAHESILRGLPIDINSATAEDLEAIPGMGPVTATTIVQQRQLHGKFKDFKDLLQVKGIGLKRLRRIQPFIKLE